MIEGLIANWVSDTESLKEVELRQTPSDPAVRDTDSAEDQGLVLSVILVVGPPDPNALSYLVPRAVFERGLPVHVGALSLRSSAGNDGDAGAGSADSADIATDELLNAMLDILEVMNPHDIVVFICDTRETLNAAARLMAP